jgi:hypothetical protein
MDDAVCAGPEVRDIFDHHELDDDAIVVSRHRPVAVLIGGQDELPASANFSASLDAVHARFELNCADMDWRTVGKENSPGNRIRGKPAVGTASSENGKAEHQEGSQPRSDHFRRFLIQL